MNSNFKQLVQYVDGNLSETEKEQIENLIFEDQTGKLLLRLNKLLKLKESLDGKMSVQGYLDKQFESSKKVLLEVSKKLQ